MDPAYLKLEDVFGWMRVVPPVREREGGDDPEAKPVDLLDTWGRCFFFLFMKRGDGGERRPGACGAAALLLIC